MFLFFSENDLILRENLGMNEVVLVTISYFQFHQNFFLAFIDDRKVSWFFFDISKVFD